MCSVSYDILLLWRRLEGSARAAQEEPLRLNQKASHRIPGTLAATRKKASTAGEIENQHVVTSVYSFPGINCRRVWPSATPPLLHADVCHVLPQPTPVLRYTILL